jgi:hypothetical protein
VEVLQYPTQAGAGFTFCLMISKTGVRQGPQGLHGFQDVQDLEWINFRHQDSEHSADLITAENILFFSYKVTSLIPRKIFKRCCHSCTTKECVKVYHLNNNFDLVVCHLMLRDPVQEIVCGHSFWKFCHGRGT